MSFSIFLFLFKNNLLLDDIKSKFADENEIMRVVNAEFTIPRHIEDVRKEFRPNFERAKRIILRMDEYLVTSEEQSPKKRFHHGNNSFVLQTLAEAATKLKRLAFHEVLSIDEALPINRINSIDEEEDSSIDLLLRSKENHDTVVVDFQAAKNLIEFEHELIKHRMNLSEQSVSKLSNMVYLKFCLILEIQRDEYESCLRLVLHDIIFKFHLSDFRLRCEMHLRKPVEKELIIEKLNYDSHLNVNSSAELILWSGDWIAQQEVELYIVMKIESSSLNKYICPKFWDMAHLHVKSIPHGASRIFLRELTPVSRPHKTVSSINTCVLIIVVLGQY